MQISKTAILSVVSQAGDEYLALLLVPYGRSNEIVLGRGASEVEAHEQLVSKLAKLIVSRIEEPRTSGEKAQDEAKTNSRSLYDRSY